LSKPYDTIKEWRPPLPSVMMVCFPPSAAPSTELTALLYLLLPSYAVILTLFPLPPGKFGKARSFLPLSTGRMNEGMFPSPPLFLASYLPSMNVIIVPPFLFSSRMRGRNGSLFPSALVRRKVRESLPSMFIGTFFLDWHATYVRFFACAHIIACSPDSLSSFLFHPDLPSFSLLFGCLCELFFGSPPL